jgi:rubredoxin
MGRGWKRAFTVPRQSFTRQNSCHHIFDWNYDEDRSRIRTGTRQMFQKVTNPKCGSMRELFKNEQRGV